MLQALVVVIVSVKTARTLFVGSSKDGVQTRRRVVAVVGADRIGD